MRDTVIIGVACLVAIGVGAWLYFSEDGEAVSETGERSLEILAEGPYSGNVTTRANYRIRSEAELAELQRMIYGNDGPSLPPVDFETREVLAIFDGTHASGGYDVTVTAVTDTKTAREVSIERFVPGDTCITSSVITSPFMLIALPKSTLPIERIETTVTDPCR